MSEQRRALILAKNELFAALCRADREIHKRSLRGPVPETWRRRRAELAARYEDAVRVWCGEGRRKQKKTEV